ncbi:MAG: ferritin [bacterium]
MLSPTLTEAFTKQMNVEFASAYLYLSMASYFEASNLKGFSRWMQVQSKEELEHAMKIYHYLGERGATQRLLTLSEPKASWDSPLTVFVDAYKNETTNTANLNALTDLAIQEKDHAATVFLHWFVNEQVEEEAVTSEIVEKLKMVQNAPAGLYIIDRELAARQ